MSATPTSRGSLSKGKNVGNQQHMKRVNQIQNPRQLVAPIHSQKVAMGGGYDPLNVQGRTAASNSAVTRGILTSGKISQEGKLKLGSGESHDYVANFVTMTNPRTDLALLTEEIPPDGVLFGRLRSNINTLVVFRTPDERARNPERLNLDRRQLDVCPLLENEHRLRLLNYQNNNIQMIQNLENLPNLIFLDLYNNKIATLEGPLSALKTLRVLMAGKNRITSISNLVNLKKLDVLDLHSNEISEIEGFDALCDLRVLNLAGNSIKTVRNLTSLQSLTELNLRRNDIELVQGLDHIPSLQRIFLSHNRIDSMDKIECIFNVKYLLELSLDGNPIADARSMNDMNSEHVKPPNNYRLEIINRIAGLRHLDLLKVTDDERQAAMNATHVNGHENFTVDLRQSSLSDIEKVKYNSLESDKSLLSYKNVSSYYTLARVGKLNTSNSLFEIEPHSSDEKSKTLVICGEGSEFNQSKRLLQNVVEIVMINMNREVIIKRLSPLMSSFSSLRIVRMICNDISSLKELQLTLEMMVPSLEHFSITNNPICAVSQLPLFCLYILPNLHYVNDQDLKQIKKRSVVQFVDPFFKALTGMKNVHRLQQCSSRQDLSPTRNRRLITPSSGRKFVSEEEIGFLVKNITTACIRSSINKYSFGKQFMHVFNVCMLEFTKDIENKLRISP